MEPIWSQATSNRLSRFVVRNGSAKANEGSTRTMTQTIFPEIQAAADALESRIALTETEIVEMKESVAAKKQLVRSWRKALAAFTPKQIPKKKKASNAS